MSFKPFGRPSTKARILVPFPILPVLPYEQVICSTKYIITLAIRWCVALSASPYGKDIRCPNGWVCPYALPFSLHYRTHRLHVDQICPSMGMSPNRSSFCHKKEGQLWPNILPKTFHLSRVPQQTGCLVQCPNRRVCLWHIFPASCESGVEHVQIRQYLCCFPLFFVVVVPSFITKQTLCALIFA